MTDFPISGVVNVNITRETLFPTRDGFGTLLLAGSGAVIDHGERIRYYTSITDVATDWAADTEEYLGALIYFSQAPKPARLGIGAVLAASPAGFMVTGAITATIATLAAIADGTFTISIDGGEEDLTAVDFSGDTDLDDIAATLQVELRAVATGGYTLCTVENIDDTQLKITSGTTGALSAVTAMSAQGTGTALEVAALLNAEAGTARIVDGYLWVDFADELLRLDDANDDWYGLALTVDLRSSANYQVAAAFVEARVKLLAAFTAEAGAYDAASTTDLLYILKAASYARTLTFYSKDTTSYPEISAFARGFTVDFTLVNTASSLKFKRLPGISVEDDLTTSQLTAIKAKNGNTYILRGGVPMMEEGIMAVGEFFDVMHFVDFLQNAIATDVFAALYTASTKIPFTDEGATVLEDATRGPLEQGVRSGAIAIDFDEDGNLLAAYTLSTLPVLDVPAGQRAARIGPPITFEARLAGAIHFATVTGTVTV